MVSRSGDALGIAMRDYQHHGELLGECVYRDGKCVQDGHIRDYYFTPRAEWRDDTIELLETLNGPVLDVGCGAGQHATWFQDHGVSVVAIDSSPGAVAAARHRGVNDVRVQDMFDLGTAFPQDHFRSALVNGTQTCLAGSMAGVSAFLGDLARVTDGKGMAVVDSYLPQELDEEFFGYRSDPRRGIAHRVMHFEYDREVGETCERLIGRDLHFVLFDPDRLVEATIGTPWELDRVVPRTALYKAVLRKAPE